MVAPSVVVVRVSFEPFGTVTLFSFGANASNVFVPMVARWAARVALHQKWCESPAPWKATCQLPQG